MSRTIDEIKADIEGAVMWCDYSKQEQLENELRLAYMDGIPLADLGTMCTAWKDGRCVVLPCKVGDTVYVVGKCENVQMNRDDDYFTGTGATECPFEETCDIEDCNDENMRVFETTVTDFWYGEQNANHPEIFTEHIGHGYMRDDFGKTVFLTREAAEAALKEENG